MNSKEIFESACKAFYDRYPNLEIIIKNKESFSNFVLGYKIGYYEALNETIES